VIESSIAGGFGSSVTAITDTNGVYNLAVIIGPCRVWSPALLIGRGTATLGEDHQSQWQ
jgi:hypothetical protein